MASFIEGWCFCLWGVTYDGNYLDTNILDLSCPVDVTMTKFQSKLFDKMDPFKTCCVATGAYFNTYHTTLNAVCMIIFVFV